MKNGNFYLWFGDLGKEKLAQILSRISKCCQLLFVLTTRVNHFGAKKLNLNWTFSKVEAAILRRTMFRKNLIKQFWLHSFNAVLCFYCNFFHVPLFSCFTRLMLYFFQIALFHVSVHSCCALSWCFSLCNVLFFLYVMSL